MQTGVGLCPCNFEAWVMAHLESQASRAGSKLKALHKMRAAMADGRLGKQIPPHMEMERYPVSRDPKIGGISPSLPPADRGSKPRILPFFRRANLCGVKSRVDSFWSAI